MSGIGHFGEVAEGPDGRLYQWVEGVDGLGNPIGFWKSLRKLAKRAIPLAQRLAPLIPYAAPVAAVLTQASPILRRAGLAGASQLGALFQAQDGTLYRMEGVEQQPELQGYVRARPVSSLMGPGSLAEFAAEDELSGFEAGEELQGMAEELSPPSVSGAEPVLEDDGVLDGLAYETELRSGEPAELNACDGYGVEAFVPEQPQTTRLFQAPSRSGAAWKPLW
jgi:hypothetical protein